MTRSCLAGLLVALALSAPALAQQATDLLGVPGPIRFDGTEYLLGWSAQPAATYIKQEYVPVGQSPESYESMLLIEFVSGEIQPADALARQVAMLDERKASDPITNYSVIQNPQTGETILDFVISTQDGRGEYIIEWNGYRYAPASDAAGQTGVMLFAISHRAYGNDASKTFLEGLRVFKDQQITALASATLPGQ